MKLNNPQHIGYLLKALNIDSDVSEGYAFTGTHLTTPSHTDAEIAAAEANLDITALQIVEFNQGIDAQIVALEAQQTPRLLREALHGVPFAVNKLNKLDADIAVLRLQLK